MKQWKGTLGMVLLFSLLLIPLTAAPARAAESWYDAYQDFVMNRGYLTFDGPRAKGVDDPVPPDFEKGESSGITHYLYDLDQDGIPELFVTNGGISASSIAAEVFQFTNREIVYLGETDGYCVGRDGSGTYPGLFFTWGGSASEIWSYIVLENGKIGAASVAESDGSWEAPQMVVKTEDENLYAAFRAVYQDGLAASAVNEYTLPEIRDMGWDAFTAAYGFAAPEPPAEPEPEPGPEPEPEPEPEPGPSIPAFVDVAASAWYAGDVEYVVKNGLMNGVGEGRFSPGEFTTRAMVATILHRLADCPPAGNSRFIDIGEGTWYTEAVGWANDQGIVNGFGEGRFHPDEIITREQLAAMLCRYAIFQGYDTSAAADLKKFNDEGEISSWAREALAWANATGIINGTSDDTLAPKGSATRAQLAAILHRFCELKPSSPTVPSRDPEKDSALPLATELSDPAVLGELKGELKEAGLAHLDVFQKWTEDFAAAAGTAGQLTGEWVSPSRLHADEFACLAGWEAMFEESDADCRMTALLLLDDLLKSDQTEKDYSGTYLMFDIDAIESSERYSILRKKQDLFTTIFGEHEPQEGESPEQIYPRVWKEMGIQIDSSQVSLIAVGITDSMSDQVFVGHAAVLVDRGEELLLVEKIAFCRPYQVTRLADRAQLMDLFRDRPEYFGDPEEAGPFIYENDKLLGELTLAAE